MNALARPCGPPDDERAKGATYGRSRGAKAPVRPLRAALAALAGRRAAVKPQNPVWQ